MDLLSQNSLTGDIKGNASLQQVPTNLLFPSTMSALSQSIPHGLFIGLDVDSELAGDEEDLRTTEPQVPSTLGKHHSPSSLGESSDEEDEESPWGTEGEPPRSHSVSLTRPNPGTLQEEQAARKMAKRLKLSGDDASLVEGFSRVCCSLSFGMDYKQNYPGTFSRSAADTFVLQRPCSQE